jgi:hypothetical protein
MKKISILVILALMLVSFSLMVSASDDYSRYAFQEHLTGDLNSYLLSGSVLNTMDLDTYPDKKCTAGINAGAYGVYPLDIYVNTNTYTGLLVPTTNAIHLLGANCTDMDVISAGGTIVSTPYISRYSKIGGIDYMPRFVFLVKNTNDSKIYIKSYKINMETSLIYLEKEVNTQLTNESDLSGMTGGCAETMLSCTDDDKIYSFWRKSKGIIYILEGDESTLRTFNITSELPALNTGKLNSIRVNSWLDDFDADSNPEIIIADRSGGINYINQYCNEIFNTYIGNYDLSTHTLTKKYNLSKTMTSGIIGGSVQCYDYTGGIPNMPINLCQIGQPSSALEFCINSNFGGSGYIQSAINKVLEIDGGVLSERMSHTSTTATKRINNIGFDFNSDTYLDWAVSDGDSLAIYSGLDDTNLWSYSVKASYSDSGTSFMFDLNHSNSNWTMVKSNGEAWDMAYTSASAKRISDWDTALTNATIGYITAGDLNGDNRKELIFANTNTLIIHSINNTERALLNLTGEQTPCTWNVPSTIEECEALVDGYYSGSNDCTPFDLLDCQADIGSTTTTSTTSTTTPGATTTTTIKGAPPIFSAIQNNIGVLFGICLMIALVVLVAGYTREPIVLILVALLGAILSAVLGLFSGGMLVVMILILVVLAILGLTVFKPGN